MLLKLIKKDKNENEIHKSFHQECTFTLEIKNVRKKLFDNKKIPINKNIKGCLISETALLFTNYILLKLYINF
ncbi:hypothetical protein GCM10023210_35500 [Chryseobacterium ginsengisoli]|uniref:Uncharacterized protein n=1 Tax=Chryseobacterium ginsengisoli TaxID=363853 RepID=A0ABP9MQF1_9FLAO